MKKTILLCWIILFVFNLTKAQSDFEGSFKMIISNEKMKQPTEITYYLKDGKIASLIDNPNMKSGQMRMIIDPSTRDILMLMDMNGKKMGMKTKMKDVEDAAQKAGVKTDVKITETKETKTIDGHVCKKVIAETEDSIIDMWVAQDIDLNIGKIMSSMRTKTSMGSKSSTGDFAKYAQYMKGPSLESIIKSKKTGEVTTMQIKDIQKGNVDAAMFDTEGYQMMDMPGMGSQK